MKKFAFVTACLLALCISISALADTAGVLWNPDDNIDNPEPMPYHSNQAIFKKRTSTKAISGPSDRTVTVRLEDAYLNIPSNPNATASVLIEVRYLTSGGGWALASSTRKTFTTNHQSITIPNMRVPANRIIYIRVSKSAYTGYEARCYIHVTD